VNEENGELGSLLLEVGRGESKILSEKKFDKEFYHLREWIQGDGFRYFEFEGNGQA